MDSIINTQPSGKISSNYDKQLWRCLDCGEVVKPWTWPIANNTKYVRREYCSCASGQAAFTLSKQAQIKTEYIEDATALIKPLAVRPYDKMLFRNWEAKRSKGAALSWRIAIERYADTVANADKKFLFVCGNYGTGKTHLAVAAVRKIAASEMITPHIVVWPALCNATKESWGNDTGSTEAQLWGDARRAGILLIDDLDKTTTSEWAMSKLFDLIDYRYSRQSLTVITANNSLGMLSKRWGRSSKQHLRDTGAAVLSRISGQLFDTIILDGQDSRWTK